MPPPISSNLASRSSSGQPPLSTSAGFSLRACTVCAGLLGRWERATAWAARTGSASSSDFAKQYAALSVRGYVVIDAVWNDGARASSWLSLPTLWRWPFCS
eukprot:3273677-Pleurochrysis_carterae.AAC.1